MVMHGYIDESYSGNQHKGLFTLVCMFIRPENLAWFEMAWQWALEKTNQELEANGKPPITRFHAADLNGGRGEFKTWTRDERVAFAKRLIRVIRDHASTHMALTMDLADLNAVWPDNGDDPMSFAYNVLTKLFMLEAGKVFEEENIAEPIAFVVERGPGIEPTVAAYRQLMSEEDFAYKGRFDSIREGNWESDVLLQVADLFGYEAYRDAVRRAQSVEEPRPSMTALLDLDSVGIKTQHLPREAIEEIKRMHDERSSRHREA